MSPRPAPKPPSKSRLLAPAASAMRAAVALAGGLEVCFVCTVDDEGIVQTARVVARGDVGSVLALPGFAARRLSYYSRRLRERVRAEGLMGLVPARFLHRRVSPSTGPT